MILDIIITVLVILFYEDVVTFLWNCDVDMDFVHPDPKITPWDMCKFIIGMRM